MKELYPRYIVPLNASLFDGSKDETKGYALQSLMFGHRIKERQTLYEYLIEFLQVAISRKETVSTEVKSDDYFPIDENINDGGMRYFPTTRMGLKRFIFFPNSKIDGKAKIDYEAYDECINQLKNSIDSEDEDSKLLYIHLIQHLMYGFNSVSQSRSWFDQNMLPICPEAIAPEGMGVKGLRANLSLDVNSEKIDSSFDFHKYTYMCRGGEVYYLHLLQALQEDPEKNRRISENIKKLLERFPQFSTICKFVENIWNKYLDINENTQPVVKNLGAIPSEYMSFGCLAVNEMNNFLNSSIHPFEKIEVLANGIILQMLRAMYGVAFSLQGYKALWVMDMSDPHQPNTEMRKMASACFSSCEEVINNYLYSGYYFYQDQLTNGKKKAKSENEIIRDAKKDSITLFRKLGKQLGVIIPIKGRGTRFTLSEVAIKFLVLSLIPPEGKMTLDAFLDLLYAHYGIVITREHYQEQINKGIFSAVNNLSFFDSNKVAFSQKMKQCGFLRDLSDATSIVENPYKLEAD